MESAMEKGRDAVPEIPSRPRVRPRRAAWFFFALASVLLVVVFLGFAPTFYLDPWFDTPEDATPMPVYLIVHAVLLTAWYGGLVLQSGLIRLGRYDVHRTVGVLGVVCAAGVVVSGAGATLALIVRAPGQPIDTLATSNTLNLITFVALVGLAIRARTRPAVHMRLMLIASIAIIGPAVGPGRMFGMYLGSLVSDFIRVPVPLVFWIPLVGAIVAYDVVTSKRLHPATALGGGLKALTTAITIWLVRSGGAAAYVGWLRGLALGG